MKRNTSTPLNYKTNRVIRGHARLYTLPLNGISAVRYRYTLMTFEYI